METIRIINFIITVIFALCYTYQFVYVPISLWMQHKDRKKKAPAVQADEQLKHYAVLISARNEEQVIGQLLNSINNQTYKGDVTTFVMADNCTDDTYGEALRHGAVAYTRTSTTQIGKGYAMEALIKNIQKDYPEGFDGFFVFDADNILTPNYIEEMHKCHLEGNEAITSYRNIKNYGDNWISSGYGLWFLRETMYLNYTRYKIGASAAISGTGFFFSNSVLKDIGGWPFHLLTEDIEFTINRVCKGRKIAFCRTAVFYDEQPTSLKQSITQRMRWARGYIQVFRHYGKDLISEIFRGNFSAFDMAMNIMPAFLLTALSITCNLTYGIIGAIAGGDVTIALYSMFETVFNACALLFVLGSITLITEWKNIHARPSRKIFSAFSFPIFMLTYIPIAFTAMFVNPGWKPIQHKATTSALTSELLRRERTEKIS
ncbi:MAG: glycosyltransferase family 2 protein [Clostridiales bacterium]|nr:glycosyltransferase family 2 protein [Clostridiales bacterium]